MFDFDDDLRPGNRLRPQVKRGLFIGALVIGAATCVGIGFALPHKPVIQYMTKEVVKTNTVQNCPDGPFTVQTINGWVFYREKETGCVFLDSHNDKDDTTTLMTVADPKHVCTKFGG